MRTTIWLAALLLIVPLASAAPSGSFPENPDDAFDPILFPVFSPPVHGQHGAEFRTIAKLWNKGSSAVTVFGFDATCDPLGDPPIFPHSPVNIAPRGDEQPILTDCSSTAGRLFFVPKGDTSIVANLRVQEMTRQAENHGVEIPVVRRADFSDTSIALVGVPNDPRFRLTLRVYSLGYGGISTVNVTVLARNGEIGSTERVALLPGPSRLPFEPSYAAFTGFLPASVYGEGDLTVLIENETPNSPPIWAFITVTNNETQHLTTVTP